MASWYPFGRITYLDYLQANSFVRDITGAVKRSGGETATAVARSAAELRATISDQTTSLVASNEALGHQFGQAFDEVSRTLDWGFNLVTERLDEVRSSVESLGAVFSYNMGLMIAQLQAQNRLLLDVAERLDSIHKTLESPTLTQAREFYRAGCQRLERGLLDKALEAFHRSEEKNDTDCLTQLQLGRLYLYGRDEDDNVIDLEKARNHLLLAARYGRAELAFVPDVATSTAESLLHAAVACYLLASEAKLARNEDTARRYLDESVRLALDACTLRPQLGAAHYQAATGLALLARPDEALKSLDSAITLDRNYAVRAVEDDNFTPVRSAVTALLERLRSDARKCARELLAARRSEVESFVYIGTNAEVLRKELEATLTRAAAAISRGSMFDCQDAIAELATVAPGPNTTDVVGHGYATLSTQYYPVASVAFSPDGALLASGGSGGNIRLWDVHERRGLATLSGCTEDVHSVAFSPDGTLLASAGSDTKIRLWDVRERRELAALSGHSHSIYSVAFSPDGILLASGDSDGTIKLWDSHERRELATLPVHVYKPVGSVAFSPDGTLLASGSWDETVKLMDVRGRRDIATLRGHTDLVDSVAFSPDGRLLASGSDDGTIRLWGIREQRSVSTLLGHSECVRSVAFSPDGALLASGGWDKTVRLWGVHERRELATLSGHSEYVRSVAFSPDGSLLASGSNDNTIRLWPLSCEGVFPRPLGEHLKAAREATEVAVAAARMSAEVERTELERRLAEDAEASARKAKETAEAASLRDERIRNGLCVKCGTRLSFVRRLSGTNTCKDCAKRT